LSARGTSTLLNNVLLSAHFRVADDPGSIRRSIRIVVRVRLVTMKNPKSFLILKG
jgi:hypothetical protein